MGWSPPRPPVGHIPHHEEAGSGGWVSLDVLGVRLKGCDGDSQSLGAAAPPLLPVDSETVPATRADYSSICSNPKIKTDKVKIFREQCQAKGIKLLSDLYQSNGFMPLNNFKRNIVFFNTLF